MKIEGGQMIRTIYNRSMKQIEKRIKKEKTTKATNKGSFNARIGDVKKNKEIFFNTVRNEMREENNK